jgi:hypothetical protein
MIERYEKHLKESLLAVTNSREAERRSPFPPKLWLRIDLFRYNQHKINEEEELLPTHACVTPKYRLKQPLTEACDRVARE